MSAASICSRKRLRIVVDAHAAFFQHHVAFGLNADIRQIEIGHAVGFELHDELQSVLRDLLVEGRVIVRGEGVVLAAVARDGLRELAARHGRRAAEHHVFEEMRQAGNARRIVHRADLVYHTFA